MSEQIFTPLDLPSQVINKDNKRYTVGSINMIDNETKMESTITLVGFNKTFQEYIDPKDIEIQRLKKQLEEMKKKYRKPRKAKRKLSEGERKEVKELIRIGEKNIAIGQEYDISDSAISRIRVEMRKAGEEV